MTHRPRFYGQWAGNPAGTPEDPRRCIEKINDPNEWYSHQCKRKRGHGPDGLYCKQHNPEAITAKRAAEDARWVKERAKQDYEVMLRRYNSECAALIEQIVTNDPYTPADGSIADLYAARPIKPE